jgi:hypothetical protein
MRHALIVFFLVIAASCGGKSKQQPEEPADDDPVGPDAFAVEYCEGYRGCADEKLRYETEGADPAPGAVEAAVESCKTTTSGLTEGQQAWLESCTGCGGSCDIYDCMDRIPTEADPAPFECDMGDPEPEPDPEG